MRKKLQRWIRNWVLIDLVGLILGVGLIVLYLLPTLVSTRQDLRDVWSNLATEIVGVWLSVRIIERLLETRNRRNQSRINLLGNLRHFLIKSKELFRYEDSDILEELEKEQKYFKERWDIRKKHLYNSEIKTVFKLEGLKPDIIESSRDLLYEVDHGDEYTLNKVKEQLMSLLEQYDKTLEELRIDIWEESNPDEI